jgi:citrate lyase subunit beta/citryl-CoA lyase
VSGRTLTPRSLLFVPGGQPDKIAKVPRWSPDVAVVDLEDAVPAAEKEAARAQAVAGLGELAGTGVTALVRVNPVHSEWFSKDIGVIAAGGAAGVVLPKYTHPRELLELRRLLGAVGRDDAMIIVGLETAGGVAGARELLAEGVDAVYFGAEDYIADLGGRRTRGGEEVLYARSQVMLAAHLSGVSAVDQAVVAVRDEQLFIDDAEQGRSMGYTGKICIHPRQVELAHQVFTPSEEEQAHARAVLDAAASGVAVVDGQMADDVHVRMAEKVLARVRVPEAG